MVALVANSYLSLIAVSLMSCRIGRINSHGFKICMFCICHPTLEHCPLLSTPLPYLAPVKYTHISCVSYTSHWWIK